MALLVGKVLILRHALQLERNVVNMPETRYQPDVERCPRHNMLCARTSHVYDNRLGTTIRTHL